MSNFEINKKTLIIGAGIVVLLIIAIVRIYNIETARIKRLHEKYPVQFSPPSKPSTSPTETTETIETFEKTESSSLIKIGRWIDERMSIVMTLYQKDDKVYLVNTGDDGSKVTTEMKVQIVKGQKRYIETESSDFGEYYLVDESGNLGVYDYQGLIFTAIKINEALNNKDDNPTVKLKPGLKGQVYKFKSTLNDVEEGGQIIHTNNETTYHTFDFENLIITQKGETSSGDWETFTFPMKSVYEDGLTTVIVVNHKGIKEAWFVITTDALGYDLDNGQRLAFYELTRIK